MARRGYDDFEREMRDRRGREQREQEQRERINPRDHRRTDARDPDHMDFTRDDHSNLRPPRDSARPMYYDQNDDPSSRGYVDERNRHRQPIDLQTERREEPSSRYQEYFLPSDDINREVITYDICRYLGNDATVRPYTYSDGRPGYLIKAYRAPTTAMIATLKQDSKRFEAEQAQRRRQFGQPGRYGQEVHVTRSPNASPGMSFGASATFDDRQRQGRPDVRSDALPPGYSGYGLDTTMEDYEDNRGAPHGYRDQEPRMESRMDPPRQPLQVNRHGQMPPVSQGYPQDQSYPTSYQIQSVPSAYYDQAITQPRTVGPNSTPPPTTGRGSQPGYSGGYPATTSGGYPTTTSGGYPATTSAGYSIPASTAPPSAARYADTAGGRIAVGYPPGVTYPSDRHAAPRR